MRRSKEDTAKTRASIVEAASLSFRKSGICETALTDVMEAAGVTQGGFYRHFASKDDLIAEATEAAFNSTIEEMQASTRKSRNRKGVRAIAEDYLSPEHRTDRAHGCPLAALASELSRSDKVTRAAATEDIVRMSESVAAQINYRRPKEVERAAMAIVATMSAALTTPRIVNDRKLEDALLVAAKAYLGELG